MAGYNEQLIRSSIIAQWEGDNFSLLPYLSKRSKKNNEVTEFVLDAKTGIDAAVRLAARLIVESLDGSSKLARSKCVACAPPHSVGTARPSSENIAKALANRFSIQHLVGALRRIEPVQKAAYAAPGERPTYDDHVRTILYVGPKLNLDGQSVVLFDDLLTRGDTSEACRTILQKATGCRVVVGVFLARTQ